MLNRFLLAVPVASLPLLLPAPAAPTTKVTADVPTEVLSLEVIKRPEMKGITYYNNKGTQVKLAMNLEGQRLLAMDEEACKITSWVDDKKTDLAKGAPTGFFHWASLDVDDDAPLGVCTVALKTEQVPGQGATSIDFDGVLAFQSATKPTEETVEVKAEEGARFTMAGIEVELTQAGKPDWGDLEMTVEFSAKQSYDVIDSIRFLDAEGEEIKSDSMGSSSMGFGGDVTHSRTYGLARACDTLTLEVTYFAEVETVEVPLAFEVTLGL